MTLASLLARTKEQMVIVSLTYGNVLAECEDGMIKDICDDFSDVSLYEMKVDKIEICGYVSLMVYVTV